MNLEFFTQKEVFFHQNLLYKINRKTTLEELLQLSKIYRKIYIDPDVHSLKKSSEFPEIFKLQCLAKIKLPNNIKLSIDYPCDMNLQYQKEFLSKSIANNLRYANNTNYICTIQSNFKDMHDFIQQFNFLKPIFSGKNKIIGLGNLCRLIKTKSNIDFGKKIFTFLNNQLTNKQIHVYGLGMKLIRSKEFMQLCQNNHVSIDSTKWTQAITTELKLKYGLNCKNSNRKIFFDEYMKELEKIGFNVIY